MSWLCNNVRPSRDLPVTQARKAATSTETAAADLSGDSSSDEISPGVAIKSTVKFPSKVDLSAVNPAAPSSPSSYVSPPSPPTFNPRTIMLMRQLGRTEPSSSHSPGSGTTSAGGASSGPAHSSSVPAINTSVSMSGAPERGVHHVSAWSEAPPDKEASGPPVVAASAPVVALTPSAIKPAKIDNFYAAVKAAVAAAKEAAVKEAAARSAGKTPVEAAPVPVMFDSGIFFMQGAVEVLMQPRLVLLLSRV